MRRKPSFRLGRPEKLTTIRPAKDADFSGIAAIFREVVAEGDSYDFPTAAGEDRIRAFWFPAAGCSFVLEDAGRIMGAVVIRPNEPNSTVANAAFIVERSGRGQGLGRRLGEFALRQAASLGFTAMQFNFVVATNEVAVRLWTSLGFGVVGRHPGAFNHARLGAVDALVMRRDLGTSQK